VALTFRDGGREDAGLVADLHAACAVRAYAHIYPDQPFPFAATRRRWRGYTGRVVIADDDGGAIGFAAFEGDWLHALYAFPTTGIAGSAGACWSWPVRFYERESSVNALPASPP
jgi:hypothetical protein